MEIRNSTNDYCLGKMIRIVPGVEDGLVAINAIIQLGNLNFQFANYEYVLYMYHLQLKFFQIDTIVDNSIQCLFSY